MIKERDDSLMVKKQSTAVREYEINGTTYIVRACVKEGVKENADTKMRRLIGKEVQKQKNS